MKKRLLAVWTAATMPLTPASAAGGGVTERWRSPVSSTRPYTSTLEVDFDARGVAMVTREALTAMLGDAGWQRLR